MIKPDYQGNNIVNLMQSIAEARNGSVGLYPKLKQFDIEPLQQARNVVLFVIDGLGYHFLKHKSDSFLHQHTQQIITSVIPSTTAAGVTAFLTGLAPQQHGLTGWFVYFRELDEIVTVLPYTFRNPKRQDETIHPDVTKLINLPSFFDLLPVQCYSIMPAFLKNSSFNRMVTGKAELIPFDTYSQCLSEIDALCKKPEKKYIYAYWSQFDAIAHEYGINSQEAHRHFEQLDAGIKTLINQLTGTDTHVIVCADHGMMDSPEAHRLSMNDYSDIQSCLYTALCGEPRLAYCHVHEQKQNEFEQLFHTQLSHAADLLKSEELLQNQFYGLGEAHPNLSSRIGQYTMVMKKNYTITEQLPGENKPNLVGYHGGLSEKELYVPVIHLQSN